MNDEYYVIAEGKIGDCCDAETTRCATGNVRAYQNNGNVVLTATDGHIAVYRRCDGRLSSDSADDTYIPGDLLKRKGRWRLTEAKPDGTKWRAQKLTATGLPTGPLYEGEPAEGRYPNTHWVLQDAGAKASVAITIDPVLLAKIGEALCDAEHRGLTLFIDADNPVTPVAVSGQHGVAAISPLDAAYPTEDKTPLADRWEKIVESLGIQDTGE